MIGIFGASGFIGRNLIEHLSSNDIPFRALSRRAVPGWESKTVLIDFSDPDTYVNYLHGLTSAVLLVSASVPATFPTDISAEVSANVVPYSRFLQAISRSNVRRIVYLSSGGAVYGRVSQRIIAEDDPTNPISTYGCGKLMIENMIRTMAEIDRWTYTLLRASNPIGAYQDGRNGQGLVARALDAAMSDSNIDIWGDGTSQRDYIDVRDLCRAITVCVNSEDAQNKVYNVGSGNVYSVNDIIDFCSRETGKPIRKNYISNKSFLVKDVILDTRKIRNELSWSPIFNINNSIRNQIDGMPYI